MGIKSAREKAGLTQIQVAEKMKISQSTIACWETGRALPRAENLKLLADILGCTVDELLSEKGVQI